VDPVDPDPDSGPQHCLELLAMHEGLELEAGGFFILILLPEADIGRGERRQLHPGGRVGKNPRFKKKKTSPVGFFWFLFGFLGFILFYFIYLPRRESF
jgi:hypothetical protein